VTTEGISGEKRIYLIIAVFLLVIVIFVFIIGSSQFTPAYIPDSFLESVWIESLEDRDSGSQLLGLSKWYSLTYKVDSEYPAYLTVATFKNLLMINEDELRDKTIETIEEKTLQQGLVIDTATKIVGERVLKNNHKTMYIIYNGNDTSKDPNEHFKIIGEVWNCGQSGVSIICIGFAQITDFAHNNSVENAFYWQEILRDENGTIENFIGEDGLIYNVICH
jgi:hypothetical protein